MQEQNENTLTEQQKDLICNYYGAFRKCMSDVTHERRLDKLFKEHFYVLIPDYEERRDRNKGIFSKEQREQSRLLMLKIAENLGK